MLVFDGIYHWKGWGGKLLLGSGTCRLRIYDLAQGGTRGPIPLRSVVVVVSDVQGSRAMTDLSVRSCAGHIATSIVRDFDIEGHRMLFVDHSPETRYGTGAQKVIPERYETVEFEWHGDNAVRPLWRALETPLL
ncbi:hypothetical protein ACFL0Q_08345, partial [Thermodesulfobacteriota bacterium]